MCGINVSRVYNVLDEVVFNCFTLRLGRNAKFKQRTYLMLLLFLSVTGSFAESGVETLKAEIVRKEFDRLGKSFTFQDIAYGTVVVGFKNVMSVPSAIHNNSPPINHHNKELKTMCKIPHSGVLYFSGMDVLPYPF